MNNNVNNIVEEILNAVKGDCQAYNRDYVVWYETDLNKDWIEVLKSDWFELMIEDELKWSLFYGDCMMTKESWNFWVICLNDVGVEEIEKKVKYGIENQI